MPVSLTSHLEGKAFEPETLAAMSAVFAHMCQRLKLRERTDPFADVVARKLVALASTDDYPGEDALRRAALAAFCLDDEPLRRLVSRPAA